MAGAGPGQGPGALGARKLPPSRSTIGRSGYWGLWGGPRPANQGPWGAHSFRNKSRKRSKARPGAARNFETRAGSGESKQESWKAVSQEARRVQGRALPHPQFRPSNRVWRALIQGHIAPGSAPDPAPDPIGTRLPPSSCGIANSHPDPREAAPGRLPGFGL